MVALALATASTVRIFRSTRKTESLYIAEIIGTNKVFRGTSSDEVRDFAISFLNSTADVSSSDAFDAGYLSKVTDYECKPVVPVTLTVPAAPAEPKIDGRKVSRTWIHNASGDAYRVLESELQGYLDRGFMLGKKLESAKISKPAKDADALHGNTGKVWYHNGSESVRLESFEVPAYVAAGYVAGRGTLNRTA